MAKYNMHYAKVGGTEGELPIYVRVSFLLLHCSARGETEAGVVHASAFPVSV